MANPASLVVRALQKIVADVGKPKPDANWMTSAFARISPAEKQLKEDCTAAIKALQAMLARSPLPSVG